MLKYQYLIILGVNNVKSVLTILKHNIKIYGNNICYMSRSTIYWCIFNFKNIYAFSLYK